MLPSAAATIADLQAKLAHSERERRDHLEMIEDASITINRLRFELHESKNNHQAAAAVIDELRTVEEAQARRIGSLTYELYSVRHERDSLRAHMAAQPALPMNHPDRPVEVRESIQNRIARASRAARARPAPEEDEFFDVEVELSPPPRRRRTEQELNRELTRSFNETKLNGSTLIDLSKN